MSRIKTMAAAVMLLGVATGAAHAEYAFSQITIPPPTGNAINPSPTGASASATSINDLGQVTVSVLGFLPTQSSPDNVDLNAIYNIHTHAFTTLPDYPGSTPGGTLTYGINNSGTTVGSYDPGNGLVQGFSRSGGQFATIDPFGANYAAATGISNNGQITGIAEQYDASGAPISGQAFAISGATTKSIQAVPSAGNYTEGFGINDAGDVVGAYGSFTGFGQSGFVDVGGVISQIVLPGSPIIVQGVKINDSGEILGTVAYTDSTAEGFIDQSGAITYLNFPGSPFTDAEGFNNEGDVVGEYLAPDGTVQAFLATPVPEPAGWAVMLAVCWGWARSRVSAAWQWLPARTSGTIALWGSRPRGACWI